MYVAVEPFERNIQLMLARRRGESVHLNPTGQVDDELESQRSSIVPITISTNHVARAVFLINDKYHVHGRSC